MSPRAAVRLRQLGFPRVHDYAGGKADWLAAGLPVEGKGMPGTALEALVRDVRTCGLEESVESVRARLDPSRPWCVVTDAGGVVLGLLAPDAEGTTVEEAMTPGPTTVRASAELAPLLDALARKQPPVVPVTDADGRLLGVVHARPRPEDGR